MNTKILDCTIRDGGYVNNWNFTKEQVRKLYETLLKSNIDYMEIGYRNSLEIYDEENRKSQWIHTTDELINETIGDIYNDNTLISLMVDYGKFDINDFSKRDKTLISLVRVTFHKKDFKEALIQIQNLKELGYNVSANIMGIMTYDKQERLELYKLISQYNIDYIYIADSYGSIKTDYLKKIILEIRESLKNINPNYKYKLGFHAHNNIQRALMNSLMCIEMDIDMIDSTLFGMGRGAGNLCTELIIYEISNINKDKYNSECILNCLEYISKNLNFNNITWGYNINYFMTAYFNIHPKYISTLIEKNITSIREQWVILDKISNTKKGTFFSLDLLSKYISN